MKKIYVKPVVEKIVFDYTQGVVASGCPTSGQTQSLLSDSCTQTGEWHTQN